MWKNTIQPKLEEYEKDCHENYYLGYLSLIDFFLYELIYLLKRIFPEKLNEFTKIKKVFQEFANISEIKSYEESTKAVKEVCPLKFCAEWKEKCCSE